MENPMKIFQDNILKEIRKNKNPRFAMFLPILKCGKNKMEKTATFVYFNSQFSNDI